METQTTIIAKNGGIIEGKDFINSGAVIGSISEKNKLIVKADNVKSENLKDKDTNKIRGGEVSFTGKDGKNIKGEIKKLNGEDVRTLLQKLKDAIFKKKKGD